MSEYRKEIFNQGSFGYFAKIMKQVGEKIPDVVVITIKHDKDHIHLHISVPLKRRVSDVVKVIKSISGRLLKKNFEYMRKVYWVIYRI